MNVSVKGMTGSITLPSQVVISDSLRLTLNYLKGVILNMGNHRVSYHLYN